ncbi:ABC transporter ATP-binding protein [bacterium]|nr:MAG: ABC transporter ATP-binding protein [bacterium]
MAIISVSNVEKIYNPDTIPVHALKQVNLEIQKGEFTAIVGPSGSGKTTLLNCIGGLDTVSSGTIHIKNIDLTNLTDKELIKFRLNHIGFVFQAYNLIPVLTALENVAFILQLQGKSTKEAHSLAKQMLDSVGLSERIHNRPAQLSGGQQQRVAVARALASQPDYVLADEPTANLDSESASKLLDIMERLNAEQGVTFLFSTHDERVIRRAKRVVTLRDGAISSDANQ